MLRIPSPKRPSDSSAKQLLRFFGLIAVFVVVGILFWHYYDRSLDQIMVRQSIWDQTKTLSKQEKEFIQEFAQAMRSRYGLGFKLKITREPVYVPKLDAKTLFIGLSPANKESVIILPPLLKNSLPDDFVSYLQNKHFSNYWGQNRWPNGLQTALRMIWEELANLQTE